MGKYLYESHMGGVYTSDQPLPWDSLYCEMCGDSDWELGFANNRKEARKLLMEHDYIEEYIRKFLDEEFPKKARKRQKKT